MSRSVKDQRRMLVHPMPTAYGSGSSLITFLLLVFLESFYVFTSIRAVSGGSTICEAPPSL